MPLTVTQDERTAMETAQQGSVKVRRLDASAEAKLEALLSESDL